MAFHRATGGFRNRPSGSLDIAHYFKSKDITIDVFTDGTKPLDDAERFMRKATEDLNLVYGGYGLSFALRSCSQISAEESYAISRSSATGSLQVLFADNLLGPSLAGNYFGHGKIALAGDCGLYVPIHEVGHMLAGVGHHLPRVGCILDAPSPECPRVLCADYCAPNAERAIEKIGTKGS